MASAHSINWFLVTFLLIVLLTIYLTETPAQRHNFVPVVIIILFVLQFIQLWILWGTNRSGGLELSTWCVLSAFIAMTGILTLSLEVNLKTFNNEVDDNTSKQRAKVNRQNALITMLLIMQIVSVIGRMLIYYKQNEDLEKQQKLRRLQQRREREL